MTFCPSKHCCFNNQPLILNFYWKITKSFDMFIIISSEGTFAETIHKIDFTVNGCKWNTFCSILKILNYSRQNLQNKIPRISKQSRNNNFEIEKKLETEIQSEDVVDSVMMRPFDLHEYLKIWNNSEVDKYVEYSIFH